MKSCPQTAYRTSQHIYPELNMTAVFHPWAIFHQSLWTVFIAHIRGDKLGVSGIDLKTIDVMNSNCFDILLHQCRFITFEGNIKILSLNHTSLWNQLLSSSHMNSHPKPVIRRLHSRGIVSFLCTRYLSCSESQANSSSKFSMSSQVIRPWSFVRLPTHHDGDLCVWQLEGILSCHFKWINMNSVQNSVKWLIIGFWTINSGLPTYCNADLCVWQCEGIISYHFKWINTNLA
jgi:hypothetical protein